MPRSTFCLALIALTAASDFARGDTPHVSPGAAALGKPGQRDTHIMSLFAAPAVASLKHGLLHPFMQQSAWRRPSVVFKGDAGGDPSSVLSDLPHEPSSIIAHVASPDRALSPISAVLRLENLDRAAAPTREAYESMESVLAPLNSGATQLFDFARGDTPHVYISSPGAAALDNHTDTTDVLVVQLSGTKRWFVCSTAAATAAAAVGPVTLGFARPPSESKLEQCTTYSAEEMASLG
jgi:hypothetical protein